MNKELYKELFKDADTNEKIFDIAADIFSETIELMLDLNIPKEILKDYIDFTDVNEFEISEEEWNLLTAEEKEQLKQESPYLFGVNES